jgi:hypothetical protein
MASAEDAELLGHPSISKTHDNVADFKELVLANRRTAVQLLTR